MRDTCFRHFHRTTRFAIMKRFLLLALCGLCLGVVTGCARSTASDGVSRTVSPTMTDEIGHQHFYSESAGYQKHDPF
jgi:hypothetical protein